MTYTSILKSSLLALSTTALLSAPALADKGSDNPSLEISHFIGTVLITQDEGPITINGEGKDMLTRNGNTVRIDGGQIFDNSNCRNVNGKVSLSFGKTNWNWVKGGYKDLDEYPSLRITVPANTTLIIEDSVVFGTAPDLAAADIALSSCADLEIGDIAGSFKAQISGSGDLQVGDVFGQSQIKISGSGDLESGDVTDLTLRISGSGNADMGDIIMTGDNTANIRVSGSGDLEAEYITGNADMRISGSGDAKLDGLDGDLVYESSGSGDLYMEDIRAGRLSVKTSGSGDVEIDEGEARSVLVSAGGSSEIDMGIKARDASVKARGASDVYIKDASGEREVSRSGAASVRIGKTRYND